MVQDRGISNEQDELVRAALAFARGAFPDDSTHGDRDEKFDADGWKKCGDFGLFGMPVPAEYGGLGLGLSPVIAVMETLGYAMADQGLLFSINAHMWTNVMPILKYGTEAQKQQFLPQLCTGEWIGANAGSEPDAGSDIFAMRTTARKVDGKYVLNGTKTFVSNARWGLRRLSSRARRRG
jgi:alkylation response protein AidB-like acyl-CoA dehydrogenase